MLSSEINKVQTLLQLQNSIVFILIIFDEYYFRINLMKNQSYFSINALKSKIIQEQMQFSPNQKETIRLKVYYTLCRKQSANISFIMNDRLLIYSEHDGGLFYINHSEKVKCPFKSFANFPKQKNYRVPIYRCIVKRSKQERNMLEVEFNEKKGKSLEYVKWRFEMGQVNAREWEKLIKEQKAKQYNLKENEKIEPDIKSEVFLEEVRIFKLRKKEQEQAFKIKINGKSIVEDISQIQQVKIEQPEKSLNRSQTDPQQSFQYQKIQQKNVEEEYAGHIVQKYKGTDWNIKYLNQPNSKTIDQFAKYVVSYIKEYLKSDQLHRESAQDFESTQIDESKRIVVFREKNVVFYIAYSDSDCAKLFREEFMTYKYIASKLNYWNKNGPNLSIPLTCIVQWAGVFFFAKSSFPQDAKIVQKHFLYQKNPFSQSLYKKCQQLSNSMKVSTEALISASSFLNLTGHYSQNSCPIIYIQEISSLLPYHPPPPSKNQFFNLTKYSMDELTEPKLLFDDLAQPANPFSPQMQKQCYQKLQANVNNLIAYLRSCELVLCGYQDTQNLFSLYGLKISFLTGVFYLIDIKTRDEQLRYIKKLFTTIIVAQIIYKQQVFPKLMDLRKKNRINLIIPTIDSVIQQYIFESQNNSLFWVKLQNHFKRQRIKNFRIEYVDRVVLMKSLMSIAKGIVFDEQKVMTAFEKAQNSEINKESILMKIQPIAESYQSPLCQIKQQIRTICTAQINDIQKICAKNIFEKFLQYKQQLTQKEYVRLLTFLSSFVSPFEKDPRIQSIVIHQIYKHRKKNFISFNQFFIQINFLRHLRLYISKLQQGLDSTKKKLTLYVRNKIQGYKQQIANLVEKVVFNFGQEHPYLCQVFEQFSLFYLYCEKNYAESVSLLQKSIILWRKTCSKRNYEMAIKKARIGELLLQIGLSIQASQQIGQAVDIFQQYNGGKFKEYASALNKLSKAQLEQNKIGKSQHSAKLSNSILQELLEEDYAKALELKQENNEQNLSQLIDLFNVYEQSSQIIFENYILYFRGAKISLNISQIEKVIFELGKTIQRNSKFLSTFDNEYSDEINKCWNSVKKRLLRILKQEIWLCFSLVIPIVKREKSGQDKINKFRQLLLSTEADIGSFKNYLIQDFFLFNKTTIFPQILFNTLRRMPEYFEKLKQTIKKEKENMNGEKNGEIQVKLINFLSVLCRQYREDINQLIDELAIL